MKREPILLQNKNKYDIITNFLKIVSPKNGYFKMTLLLPEIMMPLCNVRYLMYHDNVFKFSAEAVSARNLLERLNWFGHLRRALPDGRHRHLRNAAPIKCLPG